MVANGSKTVFFTVNFFQRSQNLWRSVGIALKIAPFERSWNSESEYISKKILTPKKIYFFRDRKKKLGNFWEIFQKWKSRKFSMKIIWFFIEKCWLSSFLKNFRKIFNSVFRSRKKIIFSELKYFFGHSFDAEKVDLSIGGIFRLIGDV